MQGQIPRGTLSACAGQGDFLEHATVRGHDWYTLLDAPVLTLDVPEWAEVAGERHAPPRLSGDISSLLYYSLA